MCTCKKIDNFFVCPSDHTNIFSHLSDRKNHYPNYIIEDSPCEETYPEFDYSKFYYKCLQCSQKWYFECYPSTPTAPIFGIKVSDLNKQLSQNYINCIKQFLVVLAHDGFSENKCIHKGCYNYSLNRIKVCLNHFGYKFNLNI